MTLNRVQKILDTKPFRYIGTTIECVHQIAGYAFNSLHFKTFLGKWKQIRSFLQIYSHLLVKPLNKKLTDLCSIKMNIKLQETEVTHQLLHLLLLNKVHFP